jgi:Helix-turn-helix domain
MSKDEWLSITEASNLVDYHPDHLRELVREGKVKARKIVTVWQVSKSSLFAYVRERERRGEKTGRKKTVDSN